MEPISSLIPEGDTITINISDPLTMTNQTEVIHIQPLLQEQGLEHGQVITELQVRGDGGGGGVEHGQVIRELQVRGDGGGVMGGLEHGPVIAELQIRGDGGGGGGDWGGGGLEHGTVIAELQIRGDGGGGGSCILRVSNTDRS